MRKTRKASLRVKILTVFSLVVLLIILAFFVLNRVFWSEYYIRNSRKALKDAYRTISALVSDDSTTLFDFTRELEHLKSVRNISFGLRTGNEWTFMDEALDSVSENDRIFLLERLQEDLILQNRGEVRILEKGENYVIQRVVLPDERQFMECFGYMKDGRGEMKGFILSMPLQSMLNAYTISNRYFLIISIILLLFGGLAVWLFTLSLTKPIMKLSELSRKMSRMDFSERFEGREADEIGILGNSMNELASQMERTILQLKMTNETLQRELQEKQQVDEMRKDFISNVSHELKTPIALIQGYAEGLRDFQDDPDSMSYYTDVIIDEADKMNRMVKKLTTLNQLEFGEEGIDPAPFDLCEMVRGLIGNSRKMQEDHQAQVTFDGPDSCICIGDEFKIEEVLNNYYSNAFNHLSGERRIRFFMEDLGVNVRLSVQNTGEQIPEDELKKIWIKFYKVDKARTREYGGSGIGLSIVKAIMDAHHKECGVYNVPDGVVFWFELEKQVTEVNYVFGEDESLPEVMDAEVKDLKMSDTLGNLKE